MVDTIIVLREKALSKLATETRDHELRRKLKDIGTSDGKNFAVYEDPIRTPRKDLIFLVKPAVPPAGSTKICEGALTIPPGVVLEVECFRLA